MKLFDTALIGTLLLCISCNNSNGSAQPAGNGSGVKENAATGGTTIATTEGGTSGGWQKLEMVSFKDAQGNLIVEMPYPSDWKIKMTRKQGEPTIEGPNGLQVVDFALKSYMYTNDPQLQQSYYQSGMQLRPWPGLKQAIEEEIKPSGEANGLSFVKYYEIPEVSKMDKWYGDQLYKAMPSENQYMAVGVEWQKANGDPYFLLIHFSVSATYNTQSWGYYSSGLQADKEYFERARKQLIFSLTNARYALEPIMEYNKQEAQRAGQSWAAFNQRMAQNQANFEAQQRAFVNKSEAINNAIMSNYKAQDAASDKQQEQFVDMINEQTKVQSTESGNQYKVESHHNQYWMNQDGDYIGTNNSTYNPNLDENMNNKKWEELKRAPY